MKISREFSRYVVLAVSLALSHSSFAQNLADGLVAYWPLDAVVGDKAPDLVSGYDLSPYVGASHTLTNGSALTLTTGIRSNCVSFNFANQVLLGYIAGAGDELPINKHPALTVSLWVNAPGAQNDRRVFSEGNLGINNPLFNIGTSSGGGGVDLFLRQQPTQAEIDMGFGNFGAGAHIVSSGTAYDNAWHHLVLVQQEDGTRTLYIDGVADGLGIPVKPAGAWNVNATSVGGILRSTAAAWSTALIDEVAVWKRALTQQEIDEVGTNFLNSVFPPLAVGLVSHWPLDAVVGDKVPDLVSGYDLSPYVGASHTLTNGSALTLATGIRSNCVSFNFANQVLLGYIAGAGDELPINKHPALTVSLWVNAPGAQNDRRVFSEGNLGNNNPLFNIGTSSGGGGVDLFLRQQPTQAELDMGFGNFGAGAHIVSSGTAYDNAWHHLVLVQQEDGTRTLYIDGVADGLGIPVKPAGAWNVNATSVGGILRSTAAAWSTALIDDVAVWKRALSEDEINEVKMNGVPKTFTRKLPLQIRTFTGDRLSVVQGDKVVLSWEASADASLSISPGIGDVLAQTQFGVGSTSITVNATTTFTLTAQRGSESTNKQTTVHVVTGVAPGWRVIEHFEFLNAGHIDGQGNWQNALNSVSGAANPATVIDTGTSNKVLGLDGAKVLAGNALNSMTVPLGSSNTVFFRFYLPPAVDDPSPVEIDINLGLTDKGLRDVQDFQGANVGPAIRLFRSSGGAGGPINLQANNGVNAAGGTYSYLADNVNNPSGTGLAVGQVYNVWLDIQNLPFDVVGGVQNGGDLYSLYIQKQGDPMRTALFQDFRSDRDGVGVDPVLGAARDPLTHLFLCATELVTPQGTNTVRFDDFFLSTNGFNATVPLPSGFFEATRIIRIFALNYGSATGFSFSWNAVLGKSYMVNRKTALDQMWTTLDPEFPFNGAVTETVTFVDPTPPARQAFYQVVENP